MSNSFLKHLDFDEQKKKVVFWLFFFCFLAATLLEYWLLYIAVGIAADALPAIYDASIVLDSARLILALKYLVAASGIGFVLVLVILTKPFREEEKGRTI